MSVIEELAAAVEPYVARGDVFVDNLHRVLTTVQADLEAIAAGEAPPGQPEAPAPDPTMVPEVDQNPTPPPPAEAPPAAPGGDSGATPDPAPADPPPADAGA